MTANYFEDGSHYEDVKQVARTLQDALNIDFELISTALADAYWYGREEASRDIDNAVIEVAGDSAATMRQASRIAKGDRS